MSKGATLDLLDIGRHCHHSDCYQLDFLPFNCDGCRKVFCLEHRSYTSHECPKPYANSRKVILCETCSTAIEITGKDGEEEVKKILENHENSEDCDPSKKKKPKCPVKRCKQVLTFSNNSTCKICQVKLCLAHRFPSDHACKGYGGKEKAAVKKFLVAFDARNGKDCGTSMTTSTNRSSTRIPSVKAS
ncbi:hypothetical protein IFM89_030274 [Coptis chinensis]|uniref:AN1-type domain-containing protein n=1 Tax=Coptis chinensis TaxID=261450 RepID=A0A835ITY3_9MAGN|nr:hypothetical protein IFM89_030274 [Coptis chinensis]